MKALKRTPLLSGILLLTGSVIGLAGLQYFMPPSFDNPPGVNQAGIAHFRNVMAMAPVAPMGVSAFSWTFRVLLAGAWIGYGMILLGGYRYEGRPGTLTLPAIGSIAVLVALLFPPSLSSDVYAYAGWGRMWVLHGWNPYVRTLGSLAEIGDPAGLIAPVGASTTHGPVWIVIVCAVVGLLRSAGLWTQVVALKLLAAAAVLATAASGRAIASHHDSRRAELALLAIGFNPVFLIEGSGSGHNDILMAALMLSGIALCLKGRTRVGYLLLGLSIGIKFVSAAIVPWLIVQEVSRQPRGKRFVAAAVALGLVLAPIVVGYAAFHVQTNVFDGIKTVYEHQTAGGTPSVLWRLAVLLLLYGVLSIAVWRFDTPGLYLSCFALFTMTLIVIGAPVPFAWYMVWPLGASLVRWDRFGLKVNLACTALAVLLLLSYTMPYAR